MINTYKKTIALKIITSISGLLWIWLWELNENIYTSAEVLLIIPAVTAMSLFSRLGVDVEVAKKNFSGNVPIFNLLFGSFVVQSIMLYSLAQFDIEKLLLSQLIFSSTFLTNYYRANISATLFLSTELNVLLLALAVLTYIVNVISLLVLINIFMLLLLVRICSFEFLLNCASVLNVIPLTIHSILNFILLNTLAAQSNSYVIEVKLAERFAGIICFAGQAFNYFLPGNLRHGARIDKIYFIMNVLLPVGLLALIIFVSPYLRLEVSNYLIIAVSILIINGFFGFYGYYLVYEEKAHILAATNVFAFSLTCSLLYFLNNHLSPIYWYGLGLVVFATSLGIINFVVIKRFV